MQNVWHEISNLAKIDLRKKDNSVIKYVSFL